MTAGPPQIRGVTSARAALPVVALSLLGGCAFAATTLLRSSGIVVWANVSADMAIAFSYVAIAAGLVHLVLHTNRRLPFNWVFLAFATFLLAGAGSHLMDVVTLWTPLYWLSTAMKFIAAGAAAIAAFAVPLAVLRITSMLSRAKLAEEYQLETLRAREALERQTIERAGLLARANAELESALAPPAPGYEAMRPQLVAAQETSGAGLRMRALPQEAGVALVHPPTHNDDLDRLEELIECARATALQKQREIEPAPQPAVVPVLAADFASRHSLLQWDIVTSTRAHDDTARYAAIAELARLNTELEARLSDRTVEVSRLNADLTRQLRDIGRSYNDLESYASALAQHEEQQRTHAQQLRALHAIASAATAQGDDQIEEALRLGLRSLGLDWAYFATIDQVTHEIVIENSLGRDAEPLVPAGERFSLDSSMLGAAIALDSRAVVVVDDATKLHKAPLLSGWSSLIAVPLSIATKPYGIIGFTSRELRPQPFTQANVEFFAVAGELISAAIERRLKNTQLESSETRYRALTDAMPQLVWVIDTAGRLEYTNERWSQFTGCTLDESRGIGLAGFYERSDMAAIDRKSDASAALGFECEARLRRSDGAYRWHLIRAVSFTGPGGMAGKRIVTGTDIEERKLSETLTAAAHSAALAATESKSRFLATMSHEIRTPMNGIVGMTELLLLTHLTEEQREYAKVVRDSGQSLLRVLNDILDYSKIEAGKVDIESVEFDLPGQIESVVELLGVQFRTKQVNLLTRVAPNVPITVLGDPGRVRQILINLAGNALKFTPAGGSVEIFVTAALTAEGKIPVRFTIKDSGIGIAPSVAQHLFQPFTQGDASTTREYGGTGLGLSISAQLVALMSGTIGVDSIPGMGSSFWFELPFPELRARRPTAATSAGFLPPAEALVPRSESILVVDDNAVNTLLAAKQFKRLGFSIKSVTSGRQCIEALEREHFDLILMDCQMPEMDGFETTQKIRQVEISTAQRVPIVAMTADARAEDRQRCLDAGMDDYLSKPTQLSGLKEVIDRWLPTGDRRQTNRAAPAAEIRKPTLGLTMLLDLFEGDSAGVQQLLEAAIGSIRADVVRIERAAATRDRKVLLEAAHRLKGTSGSIRSVRLVEIGSAIQVAAASESCNIAPALLISLREAMRAVDEDIRSFGARPAVLTADA